MIYRDEDRPDRVYAKAFKHARDGHAVYLALATTILKPGVCGYFDRNGNWETIVNLADAADVAAKGFTPIPAFSVERPTASTTTEQYGVKLSHNMRAVSVDGEALAKQLGLGGGVAVRYQSTSENAAALLTRGDISRAAARAPRSHFTDWVEQNAHTLLTHPQHPDVSELGLWVVTQTTSAQQRAIMAVRSKATEVSWGVSADAHAAGKVEASARWWTSQASSEWNPAEDKNGLVLFMQGIYWRPTRFFWESKALKPVLDKEKQQYLGPGEELRRAEVVLREGEEEGEGVWLQPELCPSEGDEEGGLGVGGSSSLGGMQSGGNTGGFSVNRDFDL